MAKNNLTSDDPSQVNMIKAGTSIKGDIDSNGDIRFEGTLIGNIQTTGKLIVGSTGVIKGEVHCKNSDVEGKIEGKITVGEQLTLKATSLIHGDIITKRLAIEPGAKFTGSCSMSSNEPQSGTTRPSETKKS